MNVVRASLKRTNDVQTASKALVVNNPNNPNNSDNPDNLIFNLCILGVCVKEQ